MKFPPVTVIRKKIADNPIVQVWNDAVISQAVETFMNEHQALGHHGWSTAAWFGLQWAECGDYINVECSECGDSLVQRTKRSELEIIRSKDIQNGKRKIS